MTDAILDNAFNEVAARRRALLAAAAARARRHDLPSDRLEEYVNVVSALGKFTAEHIAVSCGVYIYQAFDYLLSRPDVLDIGDGFFIIVPEDEDEDEDESDETE